MKIISFEVNGQAHYGVVEGDNVIDLSTRLGTECRDIIGFIRTNPLAEVERLVSAGTYDHALEDVRLLPVVPDAGKIICVGLNYEEHKKKACAPDDKPMLFARFPETLIAHGDPLIIPKVSAKLDFEAEMLVVIGKATGRYLPPRRRWTRCSVTAA